MKILDLILEHLISNISSTIFLTAVSTHCQSTVHCWPPMSIFISTVKAALILTATTFNLSRVMPNYSNGLLVGCRELKGSKHARLKVNEWIVVSPFIFVERILPEKKNGKEQESYCTCESTSLDLLRRGNANNWYIYFCEIYLCVESFVNRFLTFVIHLRGDSRSNIPVAIVVFVPPLP